ncbi:MAG: hypothetical protein V3V05_03810 [Pontiella sp.]
MAAHKGKIISPVPVGGGIRRPQFMESRPPMLGAYFDLLAPRDSRRTIVVQTTTSIRVTSQRVFECDQQSIVLNQLNQDADTWMAIDQAFRQSPATAVRVTHPCQYSLDTAFQISGSRGLVVDSAQHLQQATERTAEVGLIVFNVIINEQHEIQT